jgi:hypothetical protein
MDAKVAALASNPRLNEVQRSYIGQIESAELKGESGAIELLGVSRTLADCLVNLLKEDATRPAADRRLPDWTGQDVADRLVKPAAKGGLVLMRQIEEAALRGQPYFRFQGGLDATVSMLSQTRRFEKELLTAHAWPLAPGEEDPLAAVEAVYQRASPPLEQLALKVAEERKIRWASLGSGRRP